VATVTAAFRGAESIDASAIEKVGEIIWHHLGILGIITATWGLIAALLRRRFAGAAVVLWVIVGLVPLLGWKTLYARYLLSFWPAILLLVAWGITDLAGRLGSERLPQLRFGRIFLVLLTAFVLTAPTLRLIQRESRRHRPDPRITMTEWIESNVAEGERLILERGGAFPQSNRYSLEYVDFLGRSSPDDYRARGVRYLFGSGQERRIEGKEPFAEVLQNLASIRGHAELLWSEPPYSIYRLRGAFSWENQVREAMAAGDVATARFRLESAVIAGDASPYAWKLLGELRTATGDTLLAIEAYFESGRLDSIDVEVPLAVSNLRLAQKRWDDAIEHLLNAKELSARDPLILHNLAVAYLSRAQHRFREGGRDSARADWETAAAYARSTATVAAGDEELLEIVAQVERMGQRWGFL
jgi:hypothetical protein